MSAERNKMYFAEEFLQAKPSLQGFLALTWERRSKLSKEFNFRELLPAIFLDEEGQAQL